jgi:TatD DNase family protein
LGISYVNIHTHNRIDPPVLGIQSFDIQEINHDFAFPRYSALGLHPWNLQSANLESSIKTIETHLLNPNIIAIGECGIDRCIQTPIELQIDAFIAQWGLAEQYQKIVIIHQVKAYADFLKIFKMASPGVPMIFHGFNGNLDILKKLSPHPIYFSFGADILNSKSKATKIISEIPIEKLLLETDVWQGDIETIYQAAANLRHCSTEDLKNSIFKNYKRIFK